MGLLTYSGITTKVRAMQSRLISEEGFREMASLESVPEAAEYLGQQPSYAAIFSGLEEDQLHRGYIEQLLSLSEYGDFTKLYRFSNRTQRRFLDIYFLHYETDILKQILRRLYGHQQTALDLSLFENFFRKHASLDLVGLARAADLREFLSLLEGTVYEKLFSSLAGQETASLFDYELRIDLYYFQTMWKIKNKILSKTEQKTINQCFGCRIDLLNLQWIYRAKKYYNLPPAEILTLLIPIPFRLKNDDIHRLTFAPDLEDFIQIVKSTPYGRLPEGQLSEAPDIEALYKQILKRLYRQAGRKHPYSLAILDSYLYFKEEEIHRIITIIEGIRYGLSPGDILALADKQ